jgi:hypothetical protein
LYALCPCKWRKWLLTMTYSILISSYHSVRDPGLLLTNWSLSSVGISFVALKLGYAILIIILLTCSLSGIAHQP